METSPFLGSEGGIGGLLCPRSVYLAQTHACFRVHNIDPIFFSKSGLTVLTAEITNATPGVHSAGELAEWSLVGDVGRRGPF